MGPQMKLGGIGEPRKNKKTPRGCQYCGKTFIPTRHWQKFCSTVCQRTDWEEKHPRLGVGEEK